MPCKDVAEERRDETRNGKAALRGRRVATLVSAKGMYHLLLLACEPQRGPVLPDLSGNHCTDQASRFLEVVLS